MYAPFQRDPPAGEYRHLLGKEVRYALVRVFGFDRSLCVCLAPLSTMGFAHAHVAGGAGWYIPVGVAEDFAWEARTVCNALGFEIVRDCAPVSVGPPSRRASLQRNSYYCLSLGGAGGAGARVVQVHGYLGGHRAATERRDETKSGVPGKQILTILLSFRVKQARHARYTKRWRTKTSFISLCWEIHGQQASPQTLNGGDMIERKNTSIWSPRWSSWYPRNHLAPRSQVRISAGVGFSHFRIWG